MTNRDPVVRRAGRPSPQLIVLWAVAVGDLLMVVFLIYFFDTLGFFEEGWGWPLIIGIAIAAAIQFVVLRRILSKSARTKPAESEE